MKVSILLLNLSSSFLLIALVVVASAETRTVGVNVGDKFRYSFTTNWSSDDPTATAPSYIVDYNNTEWAQVSVTAVSGTNITGNMTRRFWNETETTMDVWVDVDTGSGNLTSFLISANLTVGDSIYTSSEWDTWFINETAPRTYSSGVRDTNHINTTSYGASNTTTSAYWDKLTGIVVVLFVGNTYQSGNYTTSWSVEMQIISSDLWVVPEFSPWTLALIMLIAFTSAIVIISTQRTRASHAHSHF